MLWRQSFNVEVRPVPSIFNVLLMSITWIADSILGCHVIATARRTEIIQQLSDEGMTVVALDVTEPKSIEQAKEEVSAITGGRLDVLVNNA